MKKTLSVFMCLLWPVTSMAAPDLAAVSAGSAFVAQNSSQTVIQQTSDRAILNWNNFDIASDHHVIFQQPNATSFTLNRVSGFSFPTYIDGRITANGSIAIVNPQGIFIGPTGVIQSAGFIASTHDILDGDAMNADNIYSFNLAPFLSSPISHQGSIQVGTNGKVILHAPHVIMNNARIHGERANINLTTADSVSIDLSQGSNYLQLVLSSGDIDIQNSSMMNVGEGDINIIAGNNVMINDSLVQSSGGDINIESVFSDISMNANTIATKGFSNRAGNVDIDTYGAAPFAHGSSENFVQLARNNISESSNGGDITIRSSQIFGDLNCIQSGGGNCTYQGQILTFQKDSQQIEIERNVQKSRANFEEKTITFANKDKNNISIDENSYLDIQIEDDLSVEE